MNIRKLFIHTKGSLQPEKFQKIQKKESLQRLLAKLKTKKDLLEQKEDLAIITLLIKKGEHMLEKLSV